MAYDEDLANRIRALVASLVGAERGIEEKPMFGGLAFLVNGHMSVAASGGGGLVVRVAPGETQEALAGDHVEPMVMAGREARGWVRVSMEGLTSESQLRSWVTRGLDYARTLPPK
jgi:hypothetical protein